MDEKLEKGKYKLDRILKKLEIYKEVLFKLGYVILYDNNYSHIRFRKDSDPLDPHPEIMDVLYNKINDDGLFTISYLKTTEHIRGVSDIQERVLVRVREINLDLILNEQL